MNDSFELDEVLQILRSGRKLDAVKRYRELKGCSLHEAKQACEAMLESPADEPREATGPSASAGLGELDEALRREIRAGRLLEAVKMHRQATGGSLYDSKQYCDRLRASLSAEAGDSAEDYTPPKVDRSSGCLGAMLLLAAAATALTALSALGL